MHNNPTHHLAQSPTCPFSLFLVLLYPPVYAHRSSPAYDPPIPSLAQLGKYSAHSPWRSAASTVAIAGHSAAASPFSVDRPRMSRARARATSTGSQDTGDTRSVEQPRGAGVGEAAKQAIAAAPSPIRCRRPPLPHASQPFDPPHPPSLLNPLVSPLLPPVFFVASVPRHQHAGAPPPPASPPLCDLHDTRAAAGRRWCCGPWCRLGAGRGVPVGGSCCSVTVALGTTPIHRRDPLGDHRPPRSLSASCNCQPRPQTVQRGAPNGRPSATHPHLPSHDLPCLPLIRTSSQLPLTLSSSS